MNSVSAEKRDVFFFFLIWTIEIIFSDLGVGLEKLEHKVMHLI
jgi:hypothetical protein